ncbi:MAG: Asp-tRNA(Asn)/Glu-tRNA(Gln) amidotransferase subunit GatB [Chitinophagaceae bacterium]
MTNQNLYETVVGLEVHAQLLTKSKLFCGDSIEYGAEPNTQVSPITLAHPGTLPKMNKKAIEFAIKMGLACHCEIEKQNYFARKNYFYPDLPKGYQVSQHTTPICKQGFVEIKSEKEEKKIRLNRIHLEEDAGKSLHDADLNNTCIDYNRAGTPLIEIVSEPDIRSSDEAFSFLTELRKLVRYLQVCDGNMEEGSFRCDANVSVRKKGDTKLGTRVEVKNLNSIRNVKRAIEYEAQRLTGLLENGETIVQQTRSFNADNGTTFSIRDKEDADDYRYFADPDLTPFHLENDFIETIRQSIPALQEERVRKYTTEWLLPEYDAYVLTDEKETADYFEKIIDFFTPAYLGARPKAASNWMLGPVKSWLNENNKGINDFPLAPEKIAGMVKLVEENKVSFSVASGKLFTYLLANPDDDPEKVAIEKNFIQHSDSGSIEPLINEILEEYAEKVIEYKKGKKGLLSLFVGEVMKRSKGKADPRVTNEILLEKLKS